MWVFWKVQEMLDANIIGWHEQRILYRIYILIEMKKNNVKVIIPKKICNNFILELIELLINKSSKI